MQKTLHDEVLLAAGLRDGGRRLNNLFQAGMKLAEYVPPLHEDEIVTALVAAGVHSGLDAGEAEPHVRNGLSTGLSAMSGAMPDLDAI